jgi:hypothetical protein
VVVAAMLALPTLWTHGFAMLAGIVALERMRRSAAIPQATDPAPRAQ